MSVEYPSTGPLRRRTDWFFAFRKLLSRSFNSLLFVLEDCLQMLVYDSFELISRSHIEVVDVIK